LSSQTSVSGAASGVERSQVVAWSCSATTLVSALLLFLVQPVISKKILPWYGGSPAVWTTCMLFFQTILLGGYAYAHLLVRSCTTRWQVRWHGFLTLAAVFTLPILPSDSWQPSPGAEPIGSILWLLAASVGLPFFALSATAPLVQNWFGGAYPGRSPYRLYALSNFGSLAAVWMFPLLIEPRLDARGQDVAWSGGFVVYLLALVATMVFLSRVRAGADAVVAPAAVAPPPLRVLHVALWVGLPALASALLVAVTSHICQEVAVVPFLWVVPLSLYLGTFIVAFDNPRWYNRAVWASLSVLSLFSVSVLMLRDLLGHLALRKRDNGELLHLGKFVPEFARSAAFEIGLFFVLLFCVGMVCHGETTRRQPPVQRLTLFYLAIAAGGAVGTGCVAILCPLVFSRFAELNIAIVLGYVAAGVVLLTWARRRLAGARFRRAGIGGVAIVLLSGFCLVSVVQYQASRKRASVEVRNFYGIASVGIDRGPSGAPRGLLLVNGTILHGYQFVDSPRRELPNTYYETGTGVELAIRTLRGDKGLRVGVVGLGAGVLATYGREGDRFRYYEIDPKVVELCRSRFTYLADSRAKVNVILGDARLSMEREPSQQFDLLVLDAFSGDAIPVHLVTQEAFRLYRRHLSPNGVLAVHITNKHLDLTQVVVRGAEEMKAQSVLIEHDGNGKEIYDVDSDWILVTSNPKVLGQPDIVRTGRVLTGKYPNAPVWTDSFSNLWQVLQWGRG